MTIIVRAQGNGRNAMDLDQLCDHCGKEANDHMLIQLAGLGECIDYVIPSFPVFQATLKHVKYSFCGADDQDNTGLCRLKWQEIWRLTLY